MRLEIKEEPRVILNLLIWTNGCVLMHLIEVEKSMGSQEQLFRELGIYSYTFTKLGLKYVLEIHLEMLSWQLGI